MYLLGSLICALLFAPVFAINRGQRTDMVIMGICFGILAVAIAHLYALSDYWNPDYLIPGLYLEDFLYGFFFGGFLSGTANLITPILLSTRKFMLDYSLLILSLLVTPLTFYILVNLLHINSIYAHIIPPLIIGLYITSRFPLLLVPSLKNALLAVLITTLAFQVLLQHYPMLFNDFWFLGNLSGYVFLDIPVEEYLFAVALGFGAAFYLPALFYRSTIPNTLPHR